jgi:short-subunit dehydrogenase
VSFFGGGIVANLKGKVALITGASSGIGAGMAREFARRGADVVLTARRWERLEALALEVRARGQRALAVRCDVARDGDLEAAVAEALEEFGRIDWVVANAGFGVAGAVHKLEIEDYRRQFETNVFGVLRTVHATRDALIASRGVIAIMGSVMSYLALPVGSAYSMSKHAVRALAGALRGEVAKYGVAVTLLAPGFVVSEIRQVDNRGIRKDGVQDPISGRLTMPTDKAARKLVKGMLRRKRVVVITGHGKIAVFLERHFPRVVAVLISILGISKRRDPEQ